MSEEKKDAQEPKKKGKKGLIIALAAVILLGGGGGGVAWYFMKPKPDAEAEAEAEHAPAAKKKPKTFTTLEPFTVNLADEGGERFAQIAIVLEVADAKIGEQLTAMMPAVRNAVLMLLSSKTSKELLTVAGKEQLAEELATAAGLQIGWTPPDDDEDEPPRKKAAVAKSEEKAADAAKSEDGEEAVEDKPVKKKKRKPKRRADPNPIEAVHFSQFIVQ